LNIFNIEEHLSCYCYSNDERPLIEVRKITQTETANHSFFFNEIVFVLKGKIHFSMHSNLSVDATKGCLIFLPANNVIHYKAFAGSLILILRLKDEIQLCHTFNLDRLSNNVKIIEKPETLELLKSNNSFKYFAKGLEVALEDGLKCQYYFQAKITEALIILRAYYSEIQLFRFFYYYFEPNVAFAEYIRANILKYSTIKEFANALNITAQQFSKRFNTVFGEAPLGWMLREKAQLIYDEICKAKEPFKDIANKYGFHIQSDFDDYCEKTFGMNAREIRKKRKKR